MGHTRPDPLESHLSWFAAQMVFWRSSRDWTQDKVAELLRLDRRTYSQYETARRPPSRALPAELDGIYGTGDLFQTIWHYAQQGHDPNWFGQFLDQEGRAEQVKVYEGQAIPGLLQHEGYARALMAMSHADDLENQVAKRLARQTIIVRDETPARLFALIEETSLHKDGWPADAMRAQLEYLLDLGERGNVHIQVVPSSSRPHLGIGGSIQILRLSDGDVGYVEAQRGGRLIWDPREVHDLEYQLDQIRSKALDIESSRQRITKAMGCIP